MTIPAFRLVAGIGNYDEGTACVVSAAAAAIRLGRGEPMGRATDTMTCISPVLRAFAIRVNDNGWWESDGERTEVLMPFVPLLGGTAGRLEIDIRRALLAVDVRGHGISSGCVGSGEKVGALCHLDV